MMADKPICIKGRVSIGLDPKYIRALEKVTNAQDSYTGKEELEDLIDPEAPEEEKEKGPFMYSLHYENIDYDAAYEYFKKQGDFSGGACSGVRNGNFFGRNFDWLYDEQVEFVVHIPRVANRFESVGICNLIPGFTREFVKSGQTSPLYKLIPFHLKDGINEYGVVGSMNVVPYDHNTGPSIPLIKKKIDLPASMLIRYVLDNFKTARSAVEFIRDYASVYFSIERHEEKYEMHYMIADENDTFLLEFIDRQAVIKDMSEGSGTNVAGKPYMTNFIVSDVIFNSDGKVYTPETQDADHDAVNTNKISPQGAGLERYNLIVTNYNTANTKDGMMNLMKSLSYSWAYPTSAQPSSPYWYTEFVGALDLVCNSPMEDFTEVIAAVGVQYTNRSRDPDSIYFGSWITCHTSVYDIKERKLYLTSQEGDTEVVYSLENKSKEEIAEIGTISGTIYTMGDNFYSDPIGNLPSISELKNSILEGKSFPVVITSQILSWPDCITVKTISVLLNDIKIYKDSSGVEKAYWNFDTDLTFVYDGSICELLGATGRTPPIG